MTRRDLSTRPPSPNALPNSADLPNRSCGAHPRLLAMLTVLAGSCAHDEISTGVWVHDLTINGAHALSTGDLEDKLATQETGWWPFASKKWFDEAAFDLDLQRVKAFYADHGYFDARVISHEVRHVKGDAVDVVIEVQENSPTLVKEVRFEGFPAD